MHPFYYVPHFHVGHNKDDVSVRFAKAQDNNCVFTYLHYIGMAVGVGHERYDISINRR